MEAKERFPPAPPSEKAIKDSIPFFSEGLSKRQMQEDASAAFSVALLFGCFYRKIPESPDRESMV